MNSENVFRNHRVLITGGLGFIGSNLAHRLVGLGADVLLVDSLVPEYGGNLFNVRGIEDRVKVNIADVRDEHAMRYLVQGQDYLFNLAGQTSHLDSMTDPYTDLDINCRAQLSILEACRKHAPDVKIVFASTRQIYGKPDRLPVDETHLLRPDGRQRHQQNGRRVVSCPLQQRLRPARLRPAPDQHVRPAHADQGRPADVSGRLAATASRRGSRSRSGAASNCATSPTPTTPWTPCLRAAAQ